MDDNLRLQQLLSKYLNNTCSKSEMEELLQWIKKAKYEPGIKHFLSDYWQEVSGLENIESKKPDEQYEDWFDDIYLKALARDGSGPAGDRNRIKHRKPGSLSGSRKTYPWIKVAAVFLISAFVYLFYNTVAEEDQPVREIVYEQKTSEAGEKIRFLLPDGTQVHLNSESTLEYPVPFDENTRKVHLSGEAYFVVQHDASRPFLVHTDELTTRVLGTSFNIRTYPEDEMVNVAVASGKVALLNSDIPDAEQQVILEGDEWASYSSVTNHFNTGSGDITSFTAWNENVLLYHDKELGVVASDLERWYGVTITFENENLKRCVIRGEHRNEPLVNVLDAIVYAFDMKYEIDGRKVKLSGDGCN